MRLSCHPYLNIWYGWLECTRPVHKLAGTIDDPIVMETNEGFPDRMGEFLKGKISIFLKIGMCKIFTNWDQNLNLSLELWALTILLATWGAGLNKSNIIIIINYIHCTRKYISTVYIPNRMKFKNCTLHLCTIKQMTNHYNKLCTLNSFCNC